MESSLTSAHTHLSHAIIILVQFGVSAQSWEAVSEARTPHAAPTQPPRRPASPGPATAVSLHSGEGEWILPPCPALGLTQDPGMSPRKLE